MANLLSLFIGSLIKVTKKEAEPFMPPKGDPLTAQQIDLMSKRIAGGLLETSSSTARKPKKPAFDMKIDVVSTGKPGPHTTAREARTTLEVTMAIERAAETQFAQRFERDAGCLKRLSSTQAIKVYDYGKDEGLYFIVLEHVQGQSLADVLSRVPPVGAAPAS